MVFALTQNVCRGLVFLTAFHHDFVHANPAPEGDNLIPLLQEQLRHLLQPSSEIEDYGAATELFRDDIKRVRRSVDCSKESLREILTNSGLKKITTNSAHGNYMFITTNESDSGNFLVKGSMKEKSKCGMRRNSDFDVMNGEVSLGEKTKSRFAHYADHMESQKEKTYLPVIVLVFETKLAGKKIVFEVTKLMESKTKKAEKFDIKGMVEGGIFQHRSKKLKNRNSTVGKDLDFSYAGKKKCLFGCPVCCNCQCVLGKLSERRLKVNNEERSEIVNRVQKDVAFLKNMKLMDYSLLLFVDPIEADEANCEFQFEKDQSLTYRDEMREFTEFKNAFYQMTIIDIWASYDNWRLRAHVVEGRASSQLRSGPYGDRFQRYVEDVVFAMAADESATSAGSSSCHNSGKF